MSNAWWPTVQKVATRFPRFRGSLGVVALVVVVLAVVFYATEDPKKEALAAGMLVAVAALALSREKPREGR